MKINLIRGLRTVGSTGALFLLCLTGTSNAVASAADPVHDVPVASIKVPGDFIPLAASFVSPTWGVVVGGSGCTIKQLCPAQLAVTSDGGESWSLLGAPTVSVANGLFRAPAQVGQVLFANPADGWLYDPYSASSGEHIWATHNGGASWQETTLPGNQMMMAISGHTVYAVAGKELYRTPVGQNAWTQVNPRTPYGPMTGDTLGASGNSVWFGSSTSSRLWTTANGVNWTRYSLPSPGTAYGQPYNLGGIAAANASDMALLWASQPAMFRTAKRVQISLNSGRTERQTAKDPPLLGDPIGFAVAPGRFGVLLIAVETPLKDVIYRSANLGQTWTIFQIPGTDGGAYLSSLEFVSATTASFVVGDPGSGQSGHLWRTANAGQTWSSVGF